MQPPIANFAVVRFCKPGILARMWWLFVRDFYRIGAAVPNAASLVPPSATIMPGSVAELISQETDIPAHAPKRRKAIASDRAAHYQRAASQGSQAFAVWHPERGFTSFSDNWASVTGLRREFCEGFHLIHQIIPEDQYAFHSAIEKARLDTQRFDMRVRCARHDTRTIACECLPPTEDYPEMMLLVRDISAQDALKQHLSTAELELAHTRQSRSAFLSCMSHELRTPLNAIIGFSAMMREEVLGKLEHEGYAEYANHIHQSGQDLLARISDLLEIAAIDAGGVHLDDEEICLDKLAAELLEMHSHALFERELQLQANTHGMRAVIDKRKLLCALSHLLENAIKHSRNGEVIQLYSTMANDGTLSLTIRDYGSGMKAEQLAHIRHALASDVSYAHIREDGIGLGLSLASQIAKQHEGRLSIDGSLLEGTLVSLHLPSNRVPHMMHPRLVKS